MPALPALLFSAEALRRLVGFKAYQVRQGVCPRGAATRQGPRTTGPIGPEALADHLVTLTIRDLEAFCNGVIRPLAKAGVLAAQVTRIVDATALDTTAQYEGCGHVTRKRQITDPRGHVHEIDVTVEGGKLLVLIDARTKIPVAATVVPLQAHETLARRALVTQARTHLAGHARRHQVVCDRGVLAGTAVWWLAQRGLMCVVPAKEHMAGTVDARAQAAAGEGVTIGRRAHTVRHGQGNTADTERLETAVVGITGLTTAEQDGTPAHGRQHHRRDFEAHPMNAVVGRRGHHRDDGPAGNTVFLTTASVAPPLQPFDADDERRLIEHGCIKESKPPWSWKHPPQNTARAVRVHVLFTLLLFALATAYRRPCEPEATGGEPVGWQRWRRHLLEHTRDLVIVLAQDASGIFPRAEDSRLVGGNIKDRPSGIGTRQQLLAKYRLTAQG
jgi:hypothetical protein